MVQRMFSKILEAIYEPIFQDCSFGFRRGVGCHTAIRQCYQHLYHGKVGYIIDLDLENYFGSIDHKKLVSILKMKITDERFIRYIVRMLKAGVLSDGELRMTDEGTPQGSCVTPRTQWQTFGCWHNVSNHNFTCLNVQLNLLYQ